MIAASRDQLAEVSGQAHRANDHLTVLGWGSNVLPADRGVPGTVVINRAQSIRRIAPDVIEADCGAALQDLFLKSAQWNMAGLSFAVGIPGTIGGALVSNAGAYRSNISEHLTEIECVRDGRREWCSPELMQFSYRDSILRRKTPPKITLLAARFKLPQGDAREIYESAKNFQRQRISKQPPQASAGSFFKNVHNAKLAASLPDLTEGMRAAGVVPAGYLIEHCKLKGARLGGAQIGRRHANFILNVRNATASDIRTLAVHIAEMVGTRFGVELEEEVLYLGDWSQWTPRGKPVTF